MEKEALEIEKLKSDILDAKNKRSREWLVTISLIIGIVGASVGSIQTLSAIKQTYKEQAFKSRMETTKIFLDKILPAIGTDDRTSKQAVRKGVYITAVTLANDYPELAPSVQAVLTISSENGDTDAAETLQNLKSTN